MKKVNTVCTLVLSILMLGCGPQLSPTQKAELNEKIERDSQGPTKNVQINGEAFSVKIAGQGRLAIVTPSQSSTVTISKAEAAAKKASGCNSVALGNFYDVVGNNKDAVIPQDTLIKFAGIIPATLTCK